MCSGAKQIILIFVIACGAGRPSFPDGRLLPECRLAGRQEFKEFNWIPEEPAECLFSHDLIRAVYFMWGVSPRSQQLKHLGEEEEEKCFFVGSPWMSVKKSAIALLE